MDSPTKYSCILLLHQDHSQSKKLKMKNIIVICCILLFSGVVYGQSGVPRFGAPPTDDNTGRKLTFIWVSPDTTNSTVTINPNASKTYVVPKPLVKNTQFNITTTGAKLFDEVVLMVKGAGAANGGHLGSYCVTFGSGITNNAQTCVDSLKSSTVQFIFDGSKWLLTSNQQDF